MNTRTSSVWRVSSATVGAWHHGHGGGFSESSTSRRIDLAMSEIARRDVAARLAAPVDDGRRPGLPDDPRALAAASGTAVRRQRLFRRRFRLQVGGTKDEVACVAAVIDRGGCTEGARAVASALGTNEKLRLGHNPRIFNLRAVTILRNTLLFVRCTVLRAPFWITPARKPSLHEDGY